ncbi:MAG: hypothetical protein AAF329_22560, partial [Cyanobacteria bacterium P01_A01_bin.17]
MVGYKSFFINALTIGVATFGFSLNAHAERPSETDETNVTNTFNYEYYETGDSEVSTYEIEVLSNRWLHPIRHISSHYEFSGEIYSETEVNRALYPSHVFSQYDDFIDCQTRDRHVRYIYSPEVLEYDPEHEYVGKVITHDFSSGGRDWDVRVDGAIDEDYARAPTARSIENVETIISDICQYAHSVDGFSNMPVSSSPTPTPSSTPEPSTSIPTTTFQIAQSYTAPTTAVSLSNVGERMAEQDQPELATAYLKGAIEEYEKARLNPNAPQPRKEEIDRTYRLLVGTLLEQERTTEAAETLDAYTVWELAYYFDVSAPRTQMRISQQPASQNYAQAKALSNSSDSSNNPTQIASAGAASSPVTILQAERDILIAHNADQAGAMASGIELAQLLEIEPNQR